MDNISTSINVRWKHFHKQHLDDIISEKDIQASGESGVAVFKNIYSGATLTTISLDKINNNIIPLPKLD